MLCNGVICFTPFVIDKYTKINNYNSWVWFSHVGTSGEMYQYTLVACRRCSSNTTLPVSSFAELGLCTETVAKLSAQGIVTPTVVQRKVRDAFS